MRKTAFLLLVLAAAAMLAAGSAGAVAKRPKHPPKFTTFPDG
jgi:hypothetical protein